MSVKKEVEGKFRYEQIQKDITVFKLKLELE